MPVCEFCVKEREKTVNCPLVSKEICFSCCFAISSGRKDIIQTLRTRTHLAKDEILSKCNECMEKRTNP